MRNHWNSFIVATSLLAGCQGIPRTDPNWPREELEVEVKVDPLVTKLLRQETDLTILEGVVSDTVLGLADVGLRFYPVPSEAYAEGQERPAFLLTVEVQDVGALLTGEAVQPSHEAKRTSDELASVRCTAKATLVRRRSSGPALTVGKSVGHGRSKTQEAGVNLSSMLDFELQAMDAYGIPPRLRSEDLCESIRRAVNEALQGLIEPINRELGAQ